MLVEVWGHNNKAQILVEPTYDCDGWVINGEYTIKRDKEKNEIYVYATKQTHSATYFGDVEYTGDYNETMNLFDETGKIVGKNLIPVNPKPVETFWGDEPPF
jgi:hypothetical protein